MLGRNGASAPRLTLWRDARGDGRIAGCAGTLQRMRVLIVDDHPIIVSGCRALLEGEPEIEVVEAQSDYIAIHSDGRDYLKTQRISDLETQLDPKNFVRVHRSFIVNLAFLQGIERFGSDGHAARLKSGKRVPISRSGYDRLRAAM